LKERDGDVISLTEEVTGLQDAYDVLQKHHDEKLSSLKALLNYLDKLRKGEPTSGLYEQVIFSLETLHYLDREPKTSSSRHVRSASTGTITSQREVNIPTVSIKPSTPKSSIRSSSEQNVAELWSRLRSKEELEKSLRSSEKKALDDVKRLLDDVESLSQRDRVRAEKVKEYHNQFLDLGATIAGKTIDEIDPNEIKASADKSILDQQCHTWKTTVTDLKKSIEDRDSQIASLEIIRQEQISQMQSEISWLSKDNEILENKLHQYLHEKKEAKDSDDSHKATIEHLSKKLRCREEEIAALRTPISSPKKVLRCLDLSTNVVMTPTSVTSDHPKSPMGQILRSKFSTQTLDLQNPRSQSMASGLSSTARLVRNTTDLGHLQRLVEALEHKRKQYKNEISEYRRERDVRTNEINDLKAQVEQMQEDEQKTKAEIDKYKSEASQKDGKLQKIIDVHRNQKTCPSSPVQSPGGRRRPSLEISHQYSRPIESVADVAARAQQFVAAIRKLDGIIENCNSRVSQLLQEFINRDTRDARGMEIVEVRRQLAEASEQRNSYLVSIESCLSVIADTSEVGRERRPSTSSNGSLSPQYARSGSLNWSASLINPQDIMNTVPLASLVELSGESAPIQSPKTGRRPSPLNLANSTTTETEYHVASTSHSPTHTRSFQPLSNFSQSPHRTQQHPTQVNTTSFDAAIHQNAVTNAFENAMSMRSPVEPYQPYRPETPPYSTIAESSIQQRSPRPRSISPRRQRTISGGNGGLRSMYQQEEEVKF
jgi:peptidoglycan hydrolase CwlO-like protein